MIYICQVCGFEFEIIPMDGSVENEVNYCPKCGKDELIVK